MKYRVEFAAAGIVTIHLLLLLAYTLPSTWVPPRMRGLAWMYVQPFFHQRWDLFAPDPPICWCELQVEQEGAWTPILEKERHYLVRRMGRPLADHVKEQLMQGDSTLHPALARAVMNMVAGDPGRVRLVSRCVDDPAHPEDRSSQEVELKMP